MMKCLVFLVCVCLVAVQAEVSKDELEKLKEIHDTCLKESGADQSMPEKAFQGEFTDDPKFKEHLLCFHKKLGTIDENGNFNEERAVEILTKKFPNEKLVRGGIKQCGVKKDTPEDTIFEFSKCLFGFVPKGINIKELLL